MSPQNIHYQKKAYFVTGTDTEIGKTLVSCALLQFLATAGLECVGMKPIASGADLVDGVWTNEDVALLRRHSSVSDPEKWKTLDQLVNPFLFREAIAPHIAAAHEKRAIDLNYIVQCYERLASMNDAVVVEGAGGFRVPLNESVESADMAQQLGLPVVLVVGMRLGCINHALLTAEAIRARGLRIAGWVGNCVTEEMNCLQENLSTLHQKFERLNVPMVGCIPPLSKPGPAAAIKHLDFSKLMA